MAAGIAFFDFDKTLTVKDSGELIALRVGVRGLVHPWAGLRFVGNGLLYKMGRVSRAAMQEIGYATYRGNALDVLVRTLDQLWEPCIAPSLSAPVMARLREHQDREHPVIVLTASAWYVAQPAVRALGADAVIGTQMEEEGSRLTGRPVTIVEGAEKARIAEQVCGERGVSLDDCWAYTDSIADVELLEVVGHPVAVGPDRELRELAGSRGWEILEHAQ